MAEVHYSKKLIPWNGYRRFVRNKVMKQLQCKQRGQRKNDDKENYQYFLGENITDYLKICL